MEYIFRTPRYSKNGNGDYKETTNRPFHFSDLLLPEWHKHLRQNYKRK